MTAPGRISLLTEVTISEISRQALPGALPSLVKATEISQGALTENLKHFIAAISSILEEATDPQSQYVPDEIELNLVVNASGGIELVGKISSGFQASIRLVLRKKG